MKKTTLHVYSKGRGVFLRGSSLFAAVAVLFCLGLIAQNAAEVPDVNELRPALQAMGTVTEFHRMAIGEPEMAAEKYFENRCFRRWKQRMEPLRKEFLTDFFVGAMEITGSYDKTAAVSAIYNPFWDAILLLELKLPEEGGHGTIAKFAMLAGETFRGEKPGKYPFKTVVAKGSFIIELATVFSKTAEHFDKTFPQKATPSLGDYAVFNLEDEMKLFGLRSAMRLALMRDMMGDKESVKIMTGLQLVLQIGQRNDFQKIFWDGKQITDIRTITDLPKDVREQFVIYSYFQRPDAAVFTYIPLFMPRLVATIVIPKDESKAPSLEVYDLNDSKDILKLLVKKTGGNKK